MPRPLPVGLASYRMTPDPSTTASSFFWSQRFSTEWGRGGHCMPQAPLSVGLWKLCYFTSWPFCQVPCSLRAARQVQPRILPPAAFLPRIPSSWVASVSTSCSLSSHPGRTMVVQVGGWGQCSDIGSSQTQTAVGWSRAQEHAGPCPLAGIQPAEPRTARVTRTESQK